MRLVRLDDELAAGHTLEAVARDCRGSATCCAWSHMLDSLLVLLAAPLRLLADPDTALRGRVSAVGAAVGGGARRRRSTWAVAPVAERRFLWAPRWPAPLAPPILA